MAYLKRGTVIKIESLKHDQCFHRSWQENTVLHHDEHVLIGYNHHTIVRESDGKKWLSEIPAVFYFYKKYWFNIIMMCQSDHFHYYCNISSPYRYDEDMQKLTYIDYDLDFIVDPDLTFKIVDQDEFLVHQQKYLYPQAVLDKIKQNCAILEQWIEKREGPFHQLQCARWLPPVVYKEK